MLLDTFACRINEFWLTYVSVNTQLTILPLTFFRMFTDMLA